MFSRQASSEDIQKYKNLQKQYHRKKAYYNYVEDLVSGDGNNPKKLCFFIKGKKCDKSGISPLRNDGVAYSDPQLKATILNDQFVSSFTEEDTYSLPSLGPSPYPIVPEFTIDLEGVTKLLQGLNPQKASGLDNLCAKFLKVAASEVVLLSS